MTGTFELTGKTGLGDYSSIVEVPSFLPDEGNRAIRYLWARSRIAQLSDYGNGDLDEAAINEITALGIQYNLLTQYTSFIAVREKIVNPNGDARDVNQPLPLPLGVSDMAVGSEPELFWLLVLAVGLGAIVLMGRRFASLTFFGSAAR